MVRNNKRRVLLLTGLFIMLASSLIGCKKNTTSTVETTWETYETPEEAGFSSEKLEEARLYYNSLGSTSAMVIYKGKVLLSWGGVTKKSNAHSVRKSFLSALYGQHVQEGTIDINKTLSELDVIDNTLLSEQEKQARIVDLLTSRSGVFLRAGEESLLMRWNRPERGIHLPGIYFYYNNWDFNVLGSIYKDLTDADVFTEFEERLATPLGMEDYTPEDSYYKYELKRSLHPSYIFRMSTRDMARFGQLYLQNGVWNGKQLIPEQWIKESTSLHAHTPISLYGYGYMWWVADSGKWYDRGLYSAIGRYGQSIDVVPEKELVFVHRVDSDSFLNRNLLYKHVNNSERLKLLDMILDAKVSVTPQ
ncbi:serine hydrolase domain-containing protein [Bacillus sp. FJAT-45350]|uniref:serine hydrolase domain-containing protein n=1 Tax=Bacillus sp. FJAT-45350 TaxID=2011014 RepID=UPI000BB6AD66|nr:serine hydrolase [Bacillus sp. FJAT-45350]